MVRSIVRAPFRTTVTTVTAGAGRSCSRDTLHGARVAEHTNEREEQDLQIEAHRPVLDVIEVVLDPALERGVAPEAVHLRPSGDPGLHVMAQHVPRNRGAEAVHEDRLLG